MIKYLKIEDRKERIKFWRDSEEFWLERYILTGDDVYLKSSLTSYNQVLYHLLKKD